MLAIEPGTRHLQDFERFISFSCFVALRWHISSSISQLAFLRSLILNDLLFFFKLLTDIVIPSHPALSMDDADSY